MNKNFMGKKKYFRKRHIFLGFSLILIGAGILILGIDNIISYIEKSNNYKKTDATIIDYHYNDKGEAAEVIEYTVNKNVFVVTSNTYSKNPRNINDETTIKYNPNNPGDVIWNLPSVVYLISSIGTIIIIIGLSIITINYLHQDELKEKEDRKRYEKHMRKNAI